MIAEFKSLSVGGSSLRRMVMNPGAMVGRLVALGDGDELTSDGWAALSGDFGDCLSA